MVGPVKSADAKKVTVNGEPTAGKAAFQAKVEEEFKAKMEEKTLDGFRDVRGGASDDPAMQARQAAEGSKGAERLQALSMDQIRDVRGAPPLAQKPDAAKIQALLDVMPG